MKASDLVALPLQIGSAVRRRRIFHPSGVLASGTIERTAPSSQGLPIESGPVVGRVSKAVGVPGDLPDLIGLAWRMPPHPSAPTPWDVLMVSAGSGLLTRFTLRPTLGWSDTTLTTLMPLRYLDQRWWLSAQLVTAVGKGLSLTSVRDRIDTGGIVFAIQQAQGTGPFEPLAKLTLTRTILTDKEHDASFDPTPQHHAWNHAGTGLAYRASWSRLLAQSPWPGRPGGTGNSSRPLKYPSTISRSGILLGAHSVPRAPVSDATARARACEHTSSYQLKSVLCVASNPSAVRRHIAMNSSGFQARAMSRSLAEWTFPS